MIILRIDYPVRFQRQKTMDTFIADFYCYESRLIIELDGAQHFTVAGKEYDLMRSGVLERYGLEVLRFTNYEIDHQFVGVCAASGSVRVPSRSKATVVYSFIIPPQDREIPFYLEYLLFARGHCREQEFSFRLQSP